MNHIKPNSLSLNKPQSIAPQRAFPWFSSSLRWIRVTGFVFKSSRGSFLISLVDEMICLSMQKKFSFISPVKFQKAKNSMEWSSHQFWNNLLHIPNLSSSENAFIQVDRGPPHSVICAALQSVCPINHHQECKDTDEQSFMREESLLVFSQMIFSGLISAFKKIFSPNFFKHLGFKKKEESKWLCLFE